MPLKISREQFEEWRESLPTQVVMEALAKSAQLQYRLWAKKQWEAPEVNQTELDRIRERVKSINGLRVVQYEDLMKMEEEHAKYKRDNPL